MFQGYSLSSAWAMLDVVLGGIAAEPASVPVLEARSKFVVHVVLFMQGPARCTDNLHCTWVVPHRTRVAASKASSQRDTGYTCKP